MFTALYSSLLYLHCLKIGTDLGSSDQSVTLCTAVQVIALKQLFCHKHVPQSVFQTRQTTNAHCQVQKVLLKKTNKLGSLIIFLFAFKTHFIASCSVMS